jgi:hypothetical protein
MSEELDQKSKYKTAGIPSVYCNHANISVSYSDLRVYLGELSPSELLINPTGSEYGQQPPHFEPRFSLVLTPEFARQLAKALTAGAAQYESIFGPLRPEISQAQLDQSLEAQKK